MATSNTPETDLASGTSAAAAQGFASDARDHSLTYSHGDGVGHDAENDHHGPTLTLLIVVFAILLIFTWITVGVTVWDFGYNMNLIVAMVIALAKAVFVGIYFMHLRWDPPVFAFVLAASLCFVTLFIIFTMLDSGETMPLIQQRALLDASGS
jgi:cytochrome c oxidase subunit 4